MTVFSQVKPAFYAAAPVVLWAGLAQAEMGAPRFVEATEVAGVAHMYGGDTDYIVGGGVAALDCNADGRPDLFFAGAANVAQLYINESEQGGPISMRLAKSTGLSASDETKVVGAYPLDIDGDAEMDIFVLRFGRNRVLRGLGGCAFEDVTDALGLPEQEDYTTAFAATWLEGDAGPVLVVGNYVDRARPLDKTGNCQPSYLLRPGVDGRYGAPEFLEPVACPLSMLFVDWSGRGTADLRVANDREYADPGVGELLFRVDQDGARALGEGDGWASVVMWGMGLAAGDIDGDGRPEIAVTNMAAIQVQTLAADAGDAPRFENIAPQLGAESQRPYVGQDVRPSTSWHVAFHDFNNDGYDDLWIVKGNVDAMPQHAAFDPDSLLLGGADGRFTEVGFEAGIALPGLGRGGAAVDLNGDGALDMVVVRRNGFVRLFQSMPDASTGGAIQIALLQDGPNRHGVGARIEVDVDGRLRSYEIAVGGGHASGTSTPLHVGIGAAQSARVRVRWPGAAAAEQWMDVPAGAKIELKR